MTDKSKPKPEIKRQTFKDDAGVPRVVFVPDGEDPKMGIPVSLDLTELYGHMPKSFQKALYEALHAQGLITPADFFTRDAADRYARALRSVIKHDFLSVQAIAQKEIKHG